MAILSVSTFETTMERSMNMLTFASSHGVDMQTLTNG